MLDSKNFDSQSDQKEIDPFKNQIDFQLSYFEDYFIGPKDEKFKFEDCLSLSQN